MTGPFGTTAGPWEFNGYGGVGIAGGNYGPAYPARPDTVCTLCDGEYTENYNKNDGRAIAQVPAMLELLLMVTEYPADDEQKELARKIAAELEVK